LKKLYFFVFFLWNFSQIYSLDFNQSLIFENKWSENKMCFTREILGNINDLYFYTIPYSFLIRSESIYFFESSTRRIFTYDIEKKTVNTSILSKKKRREFEYKHKLKRKIKDDEIELLYQRKNLDFYPHDTYYIDGKLYSSSRWINKESTSQLMREIYIFLENNKKLYSVKYNGMLFGNKILSIDDFGRIYTTTDFEELRQILIHDKNGNYLYTLTIDSKEYGKDDEHLPPFYSSYKTSYITPNGDIYIMLRKEKGIFVVKYDMSELPIESDGTIEKIINWAQYGIPEYSSEQIPSDLRKYLDQASETELRRFRNTMFALKGYTFKSQDLTDYFMPLPWYEPKVGIKSDISSLSEPQQKLLKVIRYYEKQLEK